MPLFNFILTIICSVSKTKTAYAHLSAPWHQASWPTVWKGDFLLLVQEGSLLISPLCLKKKFFLKKIGQNFSPGLFGPFCRQTLLQCFIEGIRQGTTSTESTFLCPPKTAFLLPLSPVMSCYFGKRYTVCAATSNSRGSHLRWFFRFEHKTQLAENKAHKGQRCATCAVYGSKMSQGAYRWRKSCTNRSQLSLHNLIFRAQCNSSQYDQSAVQEREQVPIWHFLRPAFLTKFISSGIETL